MSIEWPSADKIKKVELQDPNTQEIRTSEQEKIEKRANRILADQQLREILSFYLFQSIAEANGFTPFNIREFINQFKSRYGTIDSFQSTGHPEQFLKGTAHRNYDAAMSEFQELMFGLPLPKYDQDADTQELPPLNEVMSRKFKKE